MSYNQTELKLSGLSVVNSIKKEDWTFNGASTRELTHCFHDYPARMIPQIANKLLNNYGRRAKTLFDPYCGTGTSLVEAMIKGVNAVGTDLNPLARLIATAKTTQFDKGSLTKWYKQFQEFAFSENGKSLSYNPTEIEGISILDFWFKPLVSKKLWRIKEFVDNIENEKVQLFFKVAFSETVRDVSNTRNEEFKLFRYSKEKLRSFNPNVFAVMLGKLQRNKIGFDLLLETIKDLRQIPKVDVFDFNTVNGVPKELISPNTVDIVITSPPYGDSHTTVAYGQYSRLSAAWLSLPEPQKTDRNLMGGRILKTLHNFECEELDSAIKNIERVDQKRANEVSSFYAELAKSIGNVAKTIKRKGVACYVVGNRRVKGITLPTNIAIESFFVREGFKHLRTYTRSIPNKRMPHKNSPSNISGVLDSTMSTEFIVVMQKK